MQVPVKEMTMNKLEFGEIVFGGNLKKNLRIEANMNNTIIRERFKQTQASGLLGRPIESLSPQDDIAPVPLKKVLKQPTQPLHTVFTKVPPVQSN